MRYLSQMTVILLFSFLGELLNALLPFPVPASIYGMILLFLALSLRIVRIDQVKETGRFLVNIMAVLFVSPTVGILKCRDIISSYWLPILLIIVVSLLLTFFVSGKVTQMLLKKEAERRA